MDYDVLSENLNGILLNCGFIYPVEARPAIINKDNLGCEDTDFGDNKVEDFQKRRKGSAGFYLKKWSDLTVSERKHLMDYLSRVGRDNAEKALAVDLLLYTMGAPGYANLKSPAELNDSWDTYHSESNDVGYDDAFGSLRVQVNLEHQNDANSQNKNGWTVLMDAIQKRDNERVKDLITRGANIHAETKAMYVLNSNGTGFETSYDVNVAATLTPLIAAVQLGNLDAVKMLIEAGVDLNQKDSLGKTAFDRIDERIQNTTDEGLKNNFIAIKELLQGNTREDNLFEAIMAGDYSRVDTLIGSGANVNEETSEKYDVADGKFVVDKNGTTLTPLILAARCGDAVIVEKLLQAKAAVGQKDSMGWTALNWVNYRLESETNPELIVSFSKIKKLLEDAQSRGGSGRGTDEPKPVSNIHDKVLSFLKALEDGQKDTALEILNQYQDNPEFLNWKDEEGNPLWGHVIDSGDMAVSKAFFSSAVDLNVKDTLGQTPMHYVLRYGYPELLPIVLEKGLDINAVDNEGQTPLHLIWKGETSIETIKAFIDEGSEVNPKDKEGYTPLDLVYAELNNLVSEPEGISQADLVKYKSYIDVLLKYGAQNAEIQLSIEAQKALESLEPQPEDEKPTLEEFFTELRKAEINHEAVNALLEKGAVAYINETDPIKEGPTSGYTPLAIAVIRGDVQLVQTVISKGADVNKKSNDQAPLQLALQQLEEAKKTEDAAKIKAAEEIVKALKEAGAKEEEKKPEVQVVEVDSLKRTEGESLADWYARVAAYWGEEEVKLRTQIETEQAADKKKLFSLQADYHKKLAELYTNLHEKEDELAKETDPQKKKKLLTELTRLSSSLLEGVPSYYKTFHADALADSKHPLYIQMTSQTAEIQKASNAYQKELLALNQKKERPGNGGDRPDGGQDGPGGSGFQEPEVDVGTPPTTPTTPTTPTNTTGVTPALVDSVAQAKHDGAQEKSWWERNQEWIWWTLGIVVMAVLGYFGFKDGGWFNKKKKKTTTAAPNTNENTNTNTNEGTGNTNTDTNTGNTDTNTGNTNTGTSNDTLSSSGRLYSSQEVNDAIAANAHNIANGR